MSEDPFPYRGTDPVLFSIAKIIDPSIGLSTTPESMRAEALRKAGEIAKLLPAIECWSIVEQLRAPEGAEVILLCDNPDFNGQPNNVIEICDDWTRWTQVRFTGETMLECLQKALRARTEDAAVKAQERRDEGR